MNHFSSSVRHVRASEFKKKVFLVWGQRICGIQSSQKWKIICYFRVIKIVLGDFKHLIAFIKSDYCQSRHFELEKLDHLSNLTLCIPAGMHYLKFLSWWLFFSYASVKNIKSKCVT